MDEGKRRRGALAAILAAAALGTAAVPAYGALNGGGPDSAGPARDSAPNFVRDERRGEERPGGRDGDCPWKDGRGGGGGGERAPDRGSPGGERGSQEGVSTDSAALY